ncbi:senescence-associated protein 20 [Artemisia annua]|uniref:Senescence-associated protein 20 n=1 Tax=Artemisia annua TaxID=35608 RepID=A0A2U1N2A2_ARTAN|nr:senescence-associated protein 20 [Artemisia annua]
MEGLNNKIVCDFYKALAARDAKMVQYLLAPDIDWWFHGPPAHKYNLMQVLTGICEFDCNDSYEPLVVPEKFFGDVWTVENGKTITEVREYLDTSVTVTHIRKSSNVCLASPRSPKCKNMWESKLVNDASVPRLLLVV